jgi:outer membrane protein assembly factor BamB
MRKMIAISIFFILFVSLTVFSQNISEQWPGYRGYKASGVLDNADLPVKWDVKKNKNIKWKTDIEGLGMSNPVIWDDKMFITTAISEADNSGLKAGIYGNVESVDDESVHEWQVICLNKNTGELIWKQTACKGVPKQKRHSKSSHANCTVACNGKYVVAFFGSEGLYCYDMDGNIQWEKDFGVLKSVFFAAEAAEWEFASSPIIHEDILIIQCDVLESSFIATYDLASGKEIWKKEREEYPGWCTPNIYENEGKTLIAVNGYLHRGGYDFITGEEVWTMEGGGDIPIPTPIVNDELIYFNSAHGKSSPILAVKTSAEGELTLKEGETTNEYIPWSISRGGAYMQTMLVYGDYLYNFRWNGNVYCYHAKTGEEIYKEKLGKAESFTASPVASDGKIYIPNDNGKVYVIKAGEEFEILETNELEDICMVTPTITKGMIFFRTQNSIIAVGKDE